MITITNVMTEIELAQGGIPTDALGYWVDSTQDGAFTDILDETRDALGRELSEDTQKALDIYRDTVILWIKEYKIVHDINETENFLAGLRKRS